MRRTTGVTIVLAGLALASQTPLAQTVNKDAQLIVGWAEPVDTLNPATTGQRNVGPILANIFDTLVWLSPEFKIEPLLATDWSLSDDGRTYTFNLRRDVTFHDGTPFNAAAVVANIEHITDKNTQSKIAIGLLGPCKRAKATSEFTVEISCDTPFAPFLTQLGQPYMGIQSPAAIGKFGQNLGQHPTGTGPFAFVSWEPNQSVVVKRFEKYDWMARSLNHQGSPDIAQITFQFVPNPQSRVSQFQSGQAQVMQQTPGVHWKAFSATGRYNAIKVPISGMGIFAPINASKFPTDDIAVRKAIMHAVDVQGVIQLAEAGVYPVSRTPLSEGMLGYEESLGNSYPFDIKKAANLLKEAGWNKTGEFWEKDGKKLEINITGVAEKAHYMAMAQAIQGYLRDFGIDAKVTPLASPAWLSANINGDMSLTPLQYVGTDPDALRLWFTPGQYFNWSHWTNPRVTELLTLGQTELDEKNRAKLYREAQQIILDNAVMMPLRQNVDLTMTAKSVTGVTFSGGGFQYFGAAKLSK